MDAFSDISLFQAPLLTPHLWGHRALLDQILDRRRRGVLAPAVLFYGPQGVGKATLAYHVARLLLTYSDASSWPLPSEHPLWSRLAEGTHPDFFVLSSEADTPSSKSLISMERVREALSFLKWHKAEGQARVLVIDTVDAMNRSGVNALLKTLEEPRPHTFVLMVSHHVQNLPETLRSRCYALSCAPLARSVFQEALQETPLSGDDFDVYWDFSGGRLGWVELLHRYGGRSWVQSWPSPASPEFSGTMLKWVEEAHKDPHFLAFLEMFILGWVHRQLAFQELSPALLPRLQGEQDILTAFARRREMGLDSRQVLLYVLNRLRTLGLS